MNIILRSLHIITFLINAITLGIHGHRSDIRPWVAATSLVLMYACCFIAAGLIALSIQEYRQRKSTH